MIQNVSFTYVNGFILTMSTEIPKNINNINNLRNNLNDVDYNSKLK